MSGVKRAKAKVKHDESIVKEALGSETMPDVTNKLRSTFKHVIASVAETDRAALAARLDAIDEIFAFASADQVLQCCAYALSLVALEKFDEDFNLLLDDLRPLIEAYMEDRIADVKAAPPPRH
jgi:hypothetical protein